MTPEIYAKTLFESAKEKSKHDTDRIVEKFITILKRRGHMSILPRISRQISRIVFEEERKGGAIAVFASLEDKKRLSEKVKKEASVLGFDGVLKERIDEALVGGYQLRIGSALVDASYKRALLALYEKLRKAALSDYRADKLST